MKAKNRNRQKQQPDQKPVKRCPWRRSIYKNYQTQVMHESFERCHEEECMAYRNGRCARLEKEGAAT